jgi:hypothetical protein
MWIFKSKTGPTGQIEKLKARVVAKRNEQSKGIDFLETFAPMVRWATIRSIIALATRMRWKLRHLDAITTFFNGLLEEVYMIISDGFPNTGKICRLL